MELEVQKYLRSGKSLKDLEAELGIKSNVWNDLVILNYNQIDSPKIHPITMECRGLVLQLNTWNIVSMAFRRFFNYEETELNKDFNFDNAICLEKVDGSIIELFHYSQKWIYSTRGSIDNETNVNFSNVTFKQMFNETIKKNYLNFWKNLNNDYVYIFEIVGPENRVVTPYDKRALYLLGLRNKKTWEEVDLRYVQIEAANLGVKFPKLFHFNNINEMIELSKQIHTLDEGFVILNQSFDNDGISFRRIKLKNPSYVAIHRLKDSAANSMRALLRLVLENEQDEFLSYFPEYKKYIILIKEKWDQYIEDANKTFQKVKELLNAEKSKENKKKFALKVKDTQFSGWLFDCYNRGSKTIQEFYKNIEKKTSTKTVEKNLLKLLKIKDLDFSAGE